MTGALDPLLAVEYLGLLSCEITNAAVFDSDGEVLAGTAAEDKSGTLVSATADGLTISAAMNPHGLRGLLEHDMATALRALK